MDDGTMRALKALQHEHSQTRMLEAFQALVELRQRHGGLTQRLSVSIYVPQCDGCYAEERYRLGADDSTWRSPDILPKTWRSNLREHGASERDLRRTYRE